MIFEVFKIVCEERLDIKCYLKKITSRYIGMVKRKLKSSTSVELENSLEQISDTNTTR